LGATGTLVNHAGPCSGTRVGRMGGRMHARMGVAWPRLHPAVGCSLQAAPNTGQEPNSHACSDCVCARTHTAHALCVYRTQVCGVRHVRRVANTHTRARASQPPLPLLPPSRYGPHTDSVPGGGIPHFMTRTDLQKDCDEGHHHSARRALQGVRRVRRAPRSSTPPSFIAIRMANQ